MWRAICKPESKKAKAKIKNALTFVPNRQRIFILTSRQERINRKTDHFFLILRQGYSNGKSEICNRIMNDMRKLIYLNFMLLLAICMQACDMFEAHPYDAYVRGEKNLNQRFIQQIEVNLKDKKTFRFAFISDTQRWYDETEDMVNDINKRNNVDFVVHGGDLSDFGATHEFELQRDIMLGFKMPWVTLLGNHDCLGTGENVYEAIWGKPNFYFQAGNVLFICLNTNCMEYDYSEPVPDFSFLETLMKNLPEGVEKTVVAMHVPPFDLEFNNNVANVFQLYLKEFPNLLFCMHGHAHHYTVNEPFKDGIFYIQTPCAKYREYVLFTINEDGYEHELIEY